MRPNVIGNIKKYGAYRTMHFLKRKTLDKNGLDIQKTIGEACSNSEIANYKCDSLFLFTNEQAKLALFKTDASSLIHSADEICQHKFRVLNGSVTNFGSNINWLQDYKSGLICSDSQVVIERNAGTDVKRIWDLSRFYQFTTLGKAFIKTGSEKYYDEFEKELISWIENNPFGKTVNWTCSMEISIRAINLICSTILFDKRIDKKVRQLINEQIYLSGCYIRGFLEDDCITPNNHYITDLVGLIFIGIYFKDAKGCLGTKASKWLKRSVTELESEVLREVCRDGVSYEKSTAYHAYVTELLIFSGLILKYNEIEFKKKTIETIGKMVSFCEAISNEGLLPLFGDQDDSRLLRLSNRYPNENLLEVGYLVQGFQYLTEERTQEACWLFDADLIKLSKVQQKLFPDAGFYILRNEYMQVDVICGGLSCMGSGGHSHNDQLSYVLFYKGLPITIDSGTYCYTDNENERNYFRGTERHSTVCVNNAEQNPFTEGKYFSLEDITRSKCTKYDDSTFVGEHNGYSQRFGITHKRIIELHGNTLQVEDEITGKDAVTAVSNIILGTNVVQADENKFQVGDVSFEIAVEDQNALNVERTKVSPRYGEKIETLKISIPFVKKCRYTIIMEDKDA